MPSFLTDRIISLKQDISTTVINSIINDFNTDECKALDSQYDIDPFIKSKIKKCLNYLKNTGVEFSPKQRSAYEEYSEAMAYYELKTKKFAIDRVYEKAGVSTPDFIITDCNLYIELKSLSFLNGDSNYIRAQYSGLDAQIAIEEQKKNKNLNVIGESVTSPFLKNNKIPSVRELIEIYIEKINNNVGIDQFKLGETILMVDIRQLLFGSTWEHTSVAFYQEKMMKSIVSGVLWNTAFGNIGDVILKTIEFEGKENIDSKLTKNGILVDPKYLNYIKGLIFIISYSSERKYVGFFRNKEKKSTAANFIIDLCNLYNEDKNSYAYKVLQSED